MLVSAVGLIAISTSRYMGNKAAKSKTASPIPFKAKKNSLLQKLSLSGNALFHLHFTGAYAINKSFSDAHFNSVP